MVAESVVVAGTSIGRHGHAVLLRGPPGRGKSDLALRAICQPMLLPGETVLEPFHLVSDDQTVLTRAGGAVLVSAPEALRDLLEVRGIGIVRVPCVAMLRLAILVDLTDINTEVASGETVERMPDYPGRTERILGCQIDRIVLSPLEASAPQKIAFALARSIEYATREQE